MVKNHLQCRRHGFDPWVRKILWRRKWQPTAVFLPGESQGQRSLVGYSPWGCKRGECGLVTKHQQSQFCTDCDLRGDSGLLPPPPFRLCAPEAGLELHWWAPSPSGFSWTRGECGLDALPAGLGFGSDGCLSQRLPAPCGQLSPPVTAHIRSQRPRAATSPCFAGSGCPPALVVPPTLLTFLYIVFSSSPSTPVPHVSSAPELPTTSLNPLSLFPHPYVGDHDDICL